MDKVEKLENRDYSISMIRCFSMCLIICCHMMQYLQMELAWWFNVGVQIFLCISGYLYGSDKKRENTIVFYKKQFSKILIDYYVVIIPTIFIYFIFARDNINYKIAVDVFLTSNTLNGGGHLWFIAYILFCYFITPFLIDFYTYLEMKGGGIWKLTSWTLLLLIMFLLICTRFFPYFNPAIISCYIMGFFLRRIHRYDRRILDASILLFAFIMNFLKIMNNYIVSFSFLSIMGSYWLMFCDYAHMILGCAIFVILYKNFSRFKFTNSTTVLFFFSDKYSYDIYLVHQFLILGPFSLMELSPFLWGNILFIILTSILLACLVQKVSVFIKNLLHL